MKSDAGKNISVWMAGCETPRRAPLGHDISADVCVVGAGIAGLSCAYLLACDGSSVAVLDDGPIAGGQTAYTTAHLVTALDNRYYALERLHGERGARLAAKSHAAAIDAIERIVADNDIDCDFARVDGYLFCPPDESTEELTRELEAAKRAEIDAELVEHIPLDFHDFGPALHFRHQAQFHILKYMNGLTEAAEAAGVRIYTGTHVSGIDNGARVRVRTPTGPCVDARTAVVATHTPVNDRVVIHTKQAAYRTYVIGARVPRDSMPAVLLWDTPDPYHYVRMQRGNGKDNGTHDWLIVGGEDHKTGQAGDFERRYAALESWTRERFPMVQDIPLRWSGQIMEPTDSLAFIGRDPGADNVYVVTGDSGNGMTHGTIAGMLISDLVAGRGNEWAQLYDPSRKSLRATKEFARENLNVVAQLKDYATPGDVESADAVDRGCGAIVRRGLRKIAVYRGDDGQLHEHSAICTHLGCVVAWNPGEKTWDCPCHGSRYDKLDGHVINGPATRGLPPAG